MLAKHRILDLERDMTPLEFRQALAKLGLMQLQAAELLGRTPRMVRRYAYGQSPIPVPVVLLLRLLVRHDYFVPV